MSTSFANRVCESFAVDLTPRGYAADRCAFVRRLGPARGTIWLAEGRSGLDGLFMPKLSIGLDVLGPEVAVVSRDLHQLVNAEAPSQWYRWRAPGEATERARVDLLEFGIPWLDHHLILENLLQVLAEECAPKVEATKRSWWRVGGSEKQSARPNLNALSAMSHVEELLGRPKAALDTWRRHVEGHTNVTDGSALQRRLRERLIALQLAAAESNA